MSRRLKPLVAAVAIVAVATAAVAVVDTNGTGPNDRPGATEAALPRGVCDKVASPRGSNANRGTATSPYATVGKLANSLRAGETGCLRAGVYRGRVKVRKGGRAGAPTTITSAPSERATVQGRLHVD